MSDERKSATACAPRKRFVLDVAEQDKELVLLCECLAKAIEISGEKKDSIAAAMGLPDQSYLSKLLGREKGLKATHIASLPDGVKTAFARLYAEANGLIVIEAAHGELAIRNVLSGILGLLTPQLPSRADRMARGTLPVAVAVAAVNK